jgi:putative colanic acid biosynthesis glycosyltransferase
MVNAEMTRGGAARVAASLAGGINDYAPDCSAHYYHCENRRKSSHSTGLKVPLSRYINVGLARLGGAYAVADFGIANNLIDRIAGTDVLHVHNMHGYYLNFERLLLAWKDRPVVWTWHDMWAATGRCGFSFNCNRWKDGCPSCQKMNYYPAAWIDRAMSEFAKKSALYGQMKNLAIVSPSQWLADIAVERGFKSSMVHTIPNPVDTRQFQLISKLEARQKLGLAENKYTVLFLASDCNDERKGYKDFVNICENRSWQKLAVGRLPRLRVAEIRHTGIINQQKIINLYYAAADAFVIPTYADNFPNTVLESLASGTPVMGYDSGGVESQLTMRDCFVAPEGNWTAIRDRLDEFCEKGGKSTELGLQLSESAEKRWSPKVAVGRYVQLYKELLSV